jgi:hypothetical protein
MGDTAASRRFARLPVDSRPRKRPAAGRATGRLVPWAVGCWVLAAGPVWGGGQRLDFNRDVRPLLSDRCFACHGPDNEDRQAGLRLDRREVATSALDSGIIAVVPGDPAASEMVARVTTADPDLVMPPPEVGKPLKPAEAEILKRWIAEGAEYRGHWAFQRVERPALPEVRDDAWVRTPIDRFILARLEAEGLDPNPEADRWTLARRLALDLTGLPPDPAAVDAFLADTAPDAYETYVDGLLASPHYGERMAIEWLDAARYADSHGYQTDSSRSNWPWRDWLIGAYNANLRFDEFTVHQLAGDMLPQPTRDQIVATGFNRNHRINGEGGIIAEEWRVETVIDRVEATGQTWLGLTLGCARCHDHKYDPISQREFYSLFALFNNVPESGTIMGEPNRAGGNSAPVLAIPTPEQEAEIARLEQAVADARAAVQAFDQETTDKPNTQAKAAVEAARKSLAAFRRTIPTTMVMKEGPPRDAFLLVRGEYDKRGEQVLPGLPAFLPPLPEEARPDRLGLARWMVSRDNPLTARVWVNRIWERFFGTGLCKTSENLGSQAEYPSHPELLDWMAAAFMEGDGMPAVDGRPAGPWNMKAFVKLLVTSGVYRQAATVTPDKAARDPANRLLARAPRIRLPAETVRDQAIAAAGLLVPTIGGPSVRPWMPAGVWDETSRYGNLRGYTPDTGPGRYRRSMYTIWKRTAAPPTMLLFDAPSRETCQVRRSRTNTPLQALALLNETSFIEAAQALATRMLAEGGDRPGDRIARGFRLAIGREPTDAELATLVAGFESDRDAFAAAPDAARAFADVGLVEPPEGLPAAEFAAYALAANVIINLDEFVMRE